MTDNLKTRIAEAIAKIDIKTGGHDSELPPNYYVAPACELLEPSELEAMVMAVLDIVEPLLPKWLPIEQHDGKEPVLVSGGFCRDICSGSDGWNKFTGKEVAEKSCGRVYSCGDYFEIQPTHFMTLESLPTPPAKE